MMEIAQSQNTTHAKVYYWLKKYKINRRSWRDSAYLNHNPQGDPFCIKQKLTTNEKKLLLAGLMLYWAEGHRTNKHSVEIANLDARMLQLFAQFLRQICGLDEQKLTLYVQLFKGFDKNEARAYWSKALKICPEHIAITPHTDTRSKAQNQKSRFGIARIQVHNYKLKNWVDKQLQKYIQSFKI